MTDGNSLQFVDTNVLIYAHDVSAGAKRSRASALLEELWQTGNGCLSTQVLQEFYVNITLKVAAPLSPEAAARTISDVAAWQVHQPGVDDILEAISVHTREGISFWDAMILTSAGALGCEILWSEDLSHGQRFSSVLVQNPFLTG